jgi:molybdate transport system substrate-binding protein
MTMMKLPFRPSTRCINRPAPGGAPKFISTDSENRRPRIESRILGLFLVIMFSAAALFGCASKTSLAQGNEELTVFAAASLTEAFVALGDVFHAAHPTVELSLNFAGSQQLANQLSEGASADIFASANPAQMDIVRQIGRVEKKSVQVFACNRLTVIFPADNPGHLARLSDLAKPGLHIVVAAEAVPVGAYTRSFLDKAGADPALGPGFRQGVLNNVASYEQSVRAVVSKVALGEADAGIVYETDVRAVEDGAIARLTIPDNLNVTATYLLAPLVDANQPGAAESFVQFLTGPTGRQLLSEYGFQTDCAGKP